MENEIKGTKIPNIYYFWKKIDKKLLDVRCKTEYYSNQELKNIISDIKTDLNEIDKILDDIIS
jgi:hypothetical protein